MGNPPRPYGPPLRGGDRKEAPRLGGERRRLYGMLTTLTTHRYLLVTMVRREIGARFAGTSLGGLWSLIQPAILLGLYTMVFQ